LPVPLAPAVIVIQEAPLVAVQLQAGPALTLALPVPALEVKDALVAERV
jgi:hypothetical protein